MIRSVCQTTFCGLTRSLSTIDVIALVYISSFVFTLSAFFTHEQSYFATSSPMATFLDSVTHLYTSYHSERSYGLAMDINTAAVIRY